MYWRRGVMPKWTRHGLGLIFYGQGFETLGDAELRPVVTLPDGTAVWVPGRRPAQS